MPFKEAVAILLPSGEILMAVMSLESPSRDISIASPVRKSQNRTESKDTHIRYVASGESATERTSPWLRNGGPISCPF